MNGNVYQVNPLLGKAAWLFWPDLNYPNTAQPCEIIFSMRVQFQFDEPSKYVLESCCYFHTVNSIVVD